MRETDIHGYARQLLVAHGAKAVVEAAEKSRLFEEKGDVEEAKTRRRVEADLQSRRELHQS